MTFLCVFFYIFCLLLLLVLFFFRLCFTRVRALSSVAVITVRRVSNGEKNERRAHVDRRKPRNTLGSDDIIFFLAK